MHSQQYLDIGLSPDRATIRRRMIEFGHHVDPPLVGAALARFQLTSWVVAATRAQASGLP